MSLPFPEPGVRLISRDKIDEFVSLMEEYRDELAEAVANLDRHYGELEAGRRRAAGPAVQPRRLPRDA